VAGVRRLFQLNRIILDPPIINRSADRRRARNQRDRVVVARFFCRPAGRLFAQGVR
jgi:hypothetical protein